MGKRLLVMLLEVAWVLPWLVQLGGGRAWWVLLGLLLITLVLTERRLHPAVITGLLVGAAAAADLVGGVPGFFAGPFIVWRTMGTRERSRPEILGRLILAAVMLTALVVWKPTWLWTLPSLLLLGIAVLAEVSRPSGVIPKQWWAFGVGLGVVALGAALGAFVLDAWAPWRPILPWIQDGLNFLLRGLFQLVALLFGLVFPKIPKAPPHHPKVFGKRPAPHHHLVLTGHSAAEPVMVVLGILLIIAGLYWLARTLANWNPGEDNEVAALIERESLSNAADRRRPPSLTFTRLWVSHKMGQMRRRRMGPQAHETLREWTTRIYHIVPEKAVALYEEVRYGNLSDNAAHTRSVREAWPTFRRRQDPD